LSIINAMKTRIHDKIREVIRSEVCRAMAEILPSALEFQNSPPDMRQSYYDHTKDPINNLDTYLALKERLKQAGVGVEDFVLDVADFRQWLSSYPEINAVYRGMSDVYIEKCLEHYLSYTHLGLSSRDTFIDIAAAESPFSRVLRHRIGLDAYRLDLSYPKGVHGRDIGADAGATGLPEGFATALALQCSYECFMGDADIRFIQEAARILKPGGRYVIVPLYLDNAYFISTSPYCNQDGVVIDPGALKVWRDDPYRVPFSRHYSPESFIERIYEHLPEQMTGTIYFISNLPDVWQQFKGQRIYCYFLFKCIKSAAA
jgi:SAM-dependent methyltransferase